MPEQRVPDADDSILTGHVLPHIPEDARNVVVVSPRAAALQRSLTAQDPTRTVVTIASDAETALAQRAPGAADCVVFDDVLGRHADPSSLLRAARAAITDEGVVVSLVANAAAFPVVKALLRSDLTEQLGPHSRLFTHAGFIKAALDAGLLPDLVETVGSGDTEPALDAAAGLLDYVRVPRQRARLWLDTRWYVFTATKAPEPAHAAEPISFVVLINDEDQLNSNLLRSPCLQPGTAHQLIRQPGCSSAAQGLLAGLQQADHELVVLVQQDMYLSAGWDARFTQQYATAVERFGPIGVAGLFGLAYRDGEPRHLGRIVDREHLLDFGDHTPTLVDSIDEVLLALPRTTPLRPDADLGFHLYGADLALSAADQGLATVVLDAPAFHNSLFADVDASFHAARERLLAKWPDVRPLRSNMGQLDTMQSPPQPAPPYDEVAELRAQLTQLQAELVQVQAELNEVRGSGGRPWGRLTRRR